MRQSRETNERSSVRVCVREAPFNEKDGLGGDVVAYRYPSPLEKKLEIDLRISSSLRIIAMPSSRMLGFISNILHIKTKIKALVFCENFIFHTLREVSPHDKRTSRHVRLRTKAKKAVSIPTS